MRRLDGRTLAGAGLGVLVLLGALWPASAPRAIPWRVRIADEAVALSLAAPVPAASPTQAAPGSSWPHPQPTTGWTARRACATRHYAISAARVGAVLAEYESQAAGLDATFYDLGLQYGIDPAYALAFFIMEGQAGTHGVAHDTQHRKHPLHAGVSLCGGLQGL